MTLFSCSRRLLAVAASLTLACQASAVVVTLTPDLINLGDTNTASFSDAFLTLTPFIGDTQSTFNLGTARLGIDEPGTNANAFNDPDVDPNNGNEQKLQFEFTGGAGLTQIGWDFSRADGDTINDGVTITGFNQDPFASFSGSTANFPAPTFDELTGTLNFKVLGQSFGNADGFLDLGNPGASADATLLLTVTDTDQAGAQLAITTLSYEDSPQIFGDVDGDGFVTLTDFGFIRDNFYEDGVSRVQGDLTGDGSVTIADFDQWKNAFPGNGAAFASQLFSAVPEPTAALLVVLGGLLTAARRR